MAAAIMLSLAGCMPAAIGAAAGLGGGGRPPASTVSGGNNKMTAGRDVQHSRPADRSVGDALQQAEGEISEGCRTRLAQAEQAEPARSCQTRWVCLPGAPTPMRLHVCEAGGIPHAIAASPRPHIAAWKWNDAER